MCFGSVLAQTSTHESEVGGREIGKVGENRRQIGGADAEPRGEGGGVLIKGGRRNPAAVLVGVVRSAESERRKSTVDRIALDGAAKNELVAAPGVIGAAVAAGLESTASGPLRVVAGMGFMGGKKLKTVGGKKMS